MRTLQFGTGRFLRGFFDSLIESPRVINVIQSRPYALGAAQINAADEGYRVWVRGQQRGKLIDEVQIVRSLNQACVAAEDWQKVLYWFQDPELRLVVSNTTEGGLTLDPEEPNSMSAAPRSFPAKLTAGLFHRFQKGLPGLAILPFELIPGNGTRLRELVSQQAKAWRVDEQFLRWLREQNRWLCTLVDRIVVPVAQDPPWSVEDPLAVTVEPYRLLAIEDDGGGREILPADPGIEWVPDLTPLYDRKVRILNGLHTAMVARSLPRGFETVQQVVADRDERGWLMKLLNDEILPVLRPRIDGLDEYVATVWDRLENPYLTHYLADIAVNHPVKIRTRLQPTCEEFQQQEGRRPVMLSALCGEV